MLDLGCSLLLVALVLGVTLAYAVRVATSGPATSARVAREGRSRLVGKEAMEMFQWALEPLGALCEQLGVSANAVTFGSLGLAVVAGAAMALGHPGGPQRSLAAAAASGDGLDGVVARRTQTVSEAGEVLDSAVDRYCELALLGGVALALRDSAPLLLLTLLAILASFMVSYSTAKAQALALPAPRGSMRRTERAVYLLLGMALAPLAGHLAAAWERAPIVAALALIAAVGNISAVSRLKCRHARHAARGRVSRSASGVATTDSPSTACAVRKAPASSSADDAASVVPHGKFGSRRREHVRSILPRLAQPRPIAAGTLGAVVRHQLGALAATILDFGVMIAVRPRRREPPEAGTAVGAACGAGTNFALGRHWIFPSETPERAHWQAARYALVSLGSLGWNTIGELALNGGAHVQYVVARLFVSALVSLGWNYPLQRRWVFAPRGRA